MPRTSRTDKPQEIAVALFQLQSSHSDEYEVRQGEYVDVEDMNHRNDQHARWGPSRELAEGGGKGEHSGKRCTTATWTGNPRRSGEGKGRTICRDPHNCSINCIATLQTTNKPHVPTQRLPPPVQMIKSNPTHYSFSTQHHFFTCA